MADPTDSRAILHDFPRRKPFFVGIDSDGCAFDTMEVKHKECFIPNIIKHFGLAAVSRTAREAAEFVNLYSKWRGINRFPALARTFDLLAEREEVIRRRFHVPAIAGIRAWIDRETKLANPTLKAEVEKTGDPDLALAYRWSEDVNKSVSEIVRGVPPFPSARESIAKLAEHADVMVVSATPGEALKREWEEHGLAEFVTLIAGQELGSKKELLALAAKGRYKPENTLMIGDAPGDLQAARSNDVLFYPINPGGEDESWSRFHDESIARFFQGTYTGAYMDKLIDHFEALLPETPPWRRAR